MVTELVTKSDKLLPLQRENKNQFKMRRYTQQIGEGFTSCKKHPFETKHIFVAIHSAVQECNARRLTEIRKLATEKSDFRKKFFHQKVGLEVKPLAQSLFCFDNTIG